MGTFIIICIFFNTLSAFWYHFLAKRGGILVATNFHGDTDTFFDKIGKPLSKFVYTVKRLDLDI